MKKIFLIIVSTLFFAPSAFAGKGYTADVQPATCVDGDFWIDTNGATGERFYVCEEGSWVKSVGYGTSANPSFNSIHASGGNLAAANAQVTKKWITGLSYTANVTSVIYGGKHYICTSTHTADSTTEPGVGASWATVWSEVTGGGVSAWSDIQDLLTPGGTYVKADGTTGDPTGTLPTGTEGQTIQYGSGGTPAAVDLAPLAFTDNVSRNTTTGVVSVPVTATATSGSSVPFTSGGAYTALGGKQDADADLTTAAGATGAGNSKYFGTNSSGTAGFYDLPTGGSGVGGYVTAPVYSNSPCTTGTYSFHSTYGVVYCKATNTWDYQVVSGSSLAWASWNNLTPVTYAATLTITDSSATGDTFTLNSIAYDAADSPVSVSNLPTATEQITYTGSNTASCTGDITGTGPWTINASSATVGCTITHVAGDSALYTAATAIWDFENGVNDTKGTHILTPVGAPSYSGSDKKQGGYAAVLGAGSNNYFTAPDNTLLDAETANVSWSVWIKPLNYGGFNIFRKIYDIGGYVIDVDYDTANHLHLKMEESYSSTQNWTTWTPASNTWYHVAVAYNQAADIITVWVSQNTFGDVINGTTYINTRQPSNNTNPLTIGGAVNGMLIDEAVIWKGTAITAANAQSIFNGNWR